MFIEGECCIRQQFQLCIQYDNNECIDASDRVWLSSSGCIRGEHGRYA